MPTVTASEFARSFGRWQDAAHQEPVTVTSHGRVVGGFLSPEALAHFEHLKRREREVFVAGEWPDELRADLEAAEYGRIAE